jgi:ketosteroid isomerase-like protein
VIEAMLRGYNGNLDDTFAFYADNCKKMHPGADEPQGKEAMRRSEEPFLRSFTHVTTVFPHVFLTEDGVAQLWAWAGNNHGPYFGHAPSGALVGKTGAAVLWFDAAGKIDEEHEYSDYLTVPTELGFGPAGRAARQVPDVTRPPIWHVFERSARETRAVEIARAVYASWDKGEAGAPGLGRLLDDHVVWDDAREPLRTEGRAAVLEAQVARARAFQRARTTLDHLWGVEDWAVVEWSESAAHGGTFMGIAPTGKSITTHGVDFLRTNGNGVLEWWRFANNAEIVVQLGKGRDYALR